MLKAEKQAAAGLCLPPPESGAERCVCRAQLLTVLDCRYFIVMEAMVREPAASMMEDGATPQVVDRLRKRPRPRLRRVARVATSLATAPRQDQLCQVSLTLNRNLHDDPTLGVCKVLLARVTGSPTAHGPRSPSRHPVPVPVQVIHEEEMEERRAGGGNTFELIGPDADLTFNT